MPYIPPEKYAGAAAFDLLHAAAAGFIGFDQRLIHALVDDPQATLPGLVRFAESIAGDSDFDLDIELIHLFRHLNVPAAVPFYTTLVRACANESPDELTEAVVSLGAPMLQPLLDLYQEVGEEQGGDIAFMLAGLRILDRRIFDMLIERLEYDASDGALLLGLYGDPAAIPHLERILREAPDSGAALRRELQGAIEQIHASLSQTPVPTPPFDIFDLYEEEEDPEFRILSEEDRLGVLDSTSVDGTPPRIRALAAASFANDELSPAARARLFEIAKTDPDPNVRGRAWESLAHDSDQPDIYPALLEAARSAPLDERTGAVVALASGPQPSREISDLVEALYAEPAARARTIEAMWKSLDRRFQKFMVQHRRDPDPVVRHQAIIGIGYLGVASETPGLEESFHDEDFREDALLAYALAAPTEVSRSRMKPFLRRIDRLAGGLNFAEEEMLREVLDQRLVLHGMKPVFGLDFESESGAEPRDEPAVSDPAPVKLDRNAPCPCGSGKKHKKCCGA